MISARTTTGAAVSVQAEQIERNIEMTSKNGKRDHVTRMEYNALRFSLAAIAFVTALMAWRLNQKNNENIQNLVKICDKVGVEYSVETNHIGLRNRIILLAP